MSAIAPKGASSRSSAMAVARAGRAGAPSKRPMPQARWRRGAFGSGKPDDVFTIKIDAENNPPANIQQGILTIVVFFYPSRPAETIIITVGQQDAGGTATER